MNLVKVKGVWLSKTKTAYILDRIEYISSVNAKAVMYMFLREMPMSTGKCQIPLQPVLRDPDNGEHELLDAFLRLSGCTSNQTIRI